MLLEGLKLGVAVLKIQGGYGATGHPPGRRRPWNARRHWVPRLRTCHLL